jgi:hypothetical protein
LVKLWIEVFITNLSAQLISCQLIKRRNIIFFNFFEDIYSSLKILIPLIWNGFFDAPLPTPKPMLP